MARDAEDTDLEIPDLLGDEDDDAAEKEWDEELEDEVEEPEAAPPVAKAAVPRRTATAAKTKPAASALPEKFGANLLGMTADIPVQVVAVLGKTAITMQELLQMEPDQLISFGTPVSTAVDLVANGKLLAKGELIEIEGQLGVKIVKMIK